MSDSNRRQFVRRLGGLAALSLGGCKIEPILGLPPSTEDQPLRFPDLPPQIPDQLDDAETTLRAVSDQLLDRMAPLLLDGELRERPFEHRNTVTHLLTELRNIGLEPAGNRGGWLLPVPLDIIEPTGAAPRVTLRPELDAMAGDQQSPASDPLELAELGAFRQRGYALPHRNLLVALASDASAIDSYTGRVALLRAPKDLDLAQPDAAARVDLLFSSVRDAGAIGCLLLSNAEVGTIDRFRQAWQRQVRRPGSYDEAMLIEGVLGAEGRAAVERALKREQTWVLDVALATRQFPFESHDILARITGRERPDEAMVLTCAWDTPSRATIETDNLRLLASLAAFAQLADWSRRSTPPRYSLLLLLSADAGFAAGQVVHAAWASSFGTKTAALLALDRPTIGEPPPAVTLSGHFDVAGAELVRKVVAADGRDLLLADQLAVASLAPYLRYGAPVMTVGAPEPAALEDRSNPSDDPRAGIHADARLLRNLLLALSARG